MIRTVFMSQNFLEIRLINDLLIAFWESKRAWRSSIARHWCIWPSNFKFLVHNKSMVALTLLMIYSRSFSVNFYSFLRLSMPLEHQLILKIDFVFLNEFKEFERLYFFLTTLWYYIVSIIFFNPIFNFLVDFEEVLWKLRFLRWLVLFVSRSKIPCEVSLLL